MIRLEQTDDIDEIRELNALAFPSDDWIGDEHTFWIAKRDGVPVGFCSAVYRPERNYVFLSRAAVMLEARGCGLQRRMIRARVAWAKKTPADRVITYTFMHNFDSMVNLLKAGFRLYLPDTLYAGDKYQYFKLGLLSQALETAE